MADLWIVQDCFNRRAIKSYWVVRRGEEYLRGEGRYKTIRRFRTAAGARRAAEKANDAASGVSASDGKVKP